MTWLVIAAFAVSCTAHSNYSAVEEHTSQRGAVGDYRIIDVAGTTIAQGRLQTGRMEGKWLFFDSHGIKVAEFDFVNGVAHGPYRTYFGSLFAPVAAGKLETEGAIQNGRVVGLHVVYGADGIVLSKDVFSTTSVPLSGEGRREQAQSTASADVAFLRELENCVRSAR